MDEHTDEHQLSVTEELLQIFEDFSDYIDNFLFEIVTFLAVVNSFMNLLYDILSLCGFNGLKMALLPSMPFMLSLSLFIVGTKKRKGKRNTKKLAAAEAAKIENLDEAIVMFDEVLEVVDDVREVTDEEKEYIGTEENESLASQVIIDIEPNETSMEPDETSDDQREDAVDQECRDSYFRSVIGFMVNIVRKFQKKQKEDQTPTRNPNHEERNRKTAAIGNDVTTVEIVNEEGVQSNRVGERLKESSHRAEDVIQENTKKLSSGAVVVGHDLHREVDFISGHLKQEGVSLEKETIQAAKQSANKVHKGSKKISSQVHNEAEIVGDRLRDQTKEVIKEDGEKAVRFGDQEFLGSDEQDAELVNSEDSIGENTMEQTAGAPQNNKRITKKVIKGASSKAKKLNAKRKKGLRQARRKRSKSILQISRRMGRLIMRVVCRRKSSPPDSDSINQAQQDRVSDKLTNMSIPDEPITPKRMSRKIVRFFVRIYRHHRKRQKSNELPTKMALPRVHTMKSAGNSSHYGLESHYVVCNEDFSSNDIQTETELKPLILAQTEEDELSHESVADDVQAMIILHAYEIADKTLESLEKHVDEDELSHESVTGDDEQVINITGNTFRFFQKQRRSAVTMLVDSELDDSVHRNAPKTDDKAIEDFEEESNKERTWTMNSILAAPRKETSRSHAHEENCISLTIKDLESTIVLHSLPNTVPSESKNASEDINHTETVMMKTVVSVQSCSSRDLIDLTCIPTQRLPFSHSDEDFSHALIGNNPGTSSTSLEILDASFDSYL